MIGDYKFVEYDKYCNKCKHSECYEGDDPCNECLTNPAMIDSHKPMHFEERE